jgi:hypothetical protein
MAWKIACLQRCGEMILLDLPQSQIFVVPLMLLSVLPIASCSCISVLLLARIAVVVSRVCSVVS